MTVAKATACPSFFSSLSCFSAGGRRHRTSATLAEDPAWRVWSWPNAQGVSLLAMGVALPALPPVDTQCKQLESREKPCIFSAADRASAPFAWGPVFSGLMERYPWATHGLLRACSWPIPGLFLALVEPSPPRPTTTTWCIVDHTRPSSSSYIPSLTFTCHLLLFPFPSLRAAFALSLVGRRPFLLFVGLALLLPSSAGCPDSRS